MKAVIMWDASNGSLDTLVRKRKRPNLAWLVLALEKLAADEILISSHSTLKERLHHWHEMERGRFSAPVTFRFHEDFVQARKIDPFIRLFHHEGLEDPVLLVSLNDQSPLDLTGLKNALYLHPYSPVVGVRKAGCDPHSAAIEIGERNRITRFRSTAERRENEWEPAGAYYFPERFLSEGIPAFVKSGSANGRGFESFVSWLVRNFKVYAHVFAAHPGL